MKKAEVPLDIINYIMTFRIKDQVFILFQHFVSFHLNDTMSQFMGEDYLHEYHYDVSFHQWYFSRFQKRKRMKLLLSYFS